MHRVIRTTTVWLAPLLAIGTLSGASAHAVPEHAAAAASPPKPATPPASAHPSRGALRPFDDCADLRRWYVRRALPDVGPYGWRGVRMLDALAPDGTGYGSAASNAPAPQRGVGSSPTGTNVQEAGVDEPDLAKTDGSLVARVRGRHVVLTDVTGVRPHRLGDYRLPRSFRGSAQLLLAGDRLLVTGGWSPTRLIGLDIGDPARPVRMFDETFTGGRLALRQYGDTVRLVLQGSLPRFHWVRPHGSSAAALARATRANRQLVRHSRAADWLPRVRDHRTGGHHRLVDCRDVLHPRLPVPRKHRPARPGGSVPGLVTVVGFDLATPTERSTVAAITDAQTVYSSADHLYLAGAGQPSMVPLAGPWGGPGAAPLVGRFAPARGSRVDGFRLTGAAATYVGSRQLPGRLLGRWSMDERDGDLRLALTWPRTRRHPAESGIVVLRPTDGRLAWIGTVRGLGRGEDLKAVRWLGDLAFLVTFRQVDPLYAVDLADPSDPRVLGRLKTPGFSSYLHPIGADRLLGIGSRVGSDGRVPGSQAAVFDVTDLRHPVRLSRVALGRHTEPVAGWDPRAFTWLPDAHAAITMVTTWSGREQVWLLRVAPDGHLGRQRLDGPGGGRVRALPLADGRVALVGKRVVLVDVR